MVTTSSLGKILAIVLFAVRPLIGLTCGSLFRHLILFGFIFLLLLLLRLVPTLSALAGGSLQVNPVALPATITFASVSAGGLHNCGVKSDGTVHCWGSMPLDRRPIRAERLHR